VLSSLVGACLGTLVHVLFSRLSIAFCTCSDGCSTCPIFCVQCTLYVSARWRDFLPSSTICNAMLTAGFSVNWLTRGVGTVEWRHLSESGARLRSRISEFGLSSVFGLVCVPHMKHWVLVLFGTNMATARSFHLPSQPCGSPSDCIGCTFCRGTEHLHLHGGRSRDGQKRHLWVFHGNAGLMDKCATASSFKMLYPLHSDRSYIFFRRRLTAVVRLAV